MKTWDEVVVRLRELEEKVCHDYAGPPLPGEDAAKAEARALFWVIGVSRIPSWAAN